MEHQKQNGISEDTLLKIFLQRYGKPLIKEALLEFLKENELVLVSLKESKPKLLTTTEVAKYLSVERHTVYQYMKLGLPAFKVGKAHKFRLDDIETFVRTRITDSMPPRQSRSDNFSKIFST